MSQDAARRADARPRPGPAAGCDQADAGPATAPTEGLTEDEQAATPAGRFLSYFARAASVGRHDGARTRCSTTTTPSAKRTEEGLRPLAAGAPAVLLGRAGAVVLASRPRAFHVRLDGPVERRVAWAASHEQLDLEATKRRQSRGGQGPVRSS